MSKIKNPETGWNLGQLREKQYSFHCKKFVVSIFPERLTPFLVSYIKDNAFILNYQIIYSNKNIMIKLHLSIACCL